MVRRWEFEKQVCWKCLHNVSPERSIDKIWIPRRLLYQAERTSRLHRQKLEYVGADRCSLCRNQDRLRTQIPHYERSARSAGLPSLLWCSLLRLVRNERGHHRRDRSKGRRTDSSVSSAPKYTDPQSWGLAKVGCKKDWCRRSSSVTFGWMMLLSRTVVSTVIQNWNHIWQESCPPIFWKVIFKNIFPEIHPPPIQKDE